MAIITSLAGYLTTFLPILTDGRELVEFGGHPVTLGQLLTFIVCTICYGDAFILVSSINGAGKLNFWRLFQSAWVCPVYCCRFVRFQTALFESFISNRIRRQSIGLGGQVHNAAISTLWAFVGIESAVILSGRASSQRDVKRATITGLLIALGIYMIITLITMGVIPHDQLQASDKPFVDVLHVIIGSFGSVIMAVLAIVSLFGSMLGWI
ncbi:amino acid permease [Bacillus licheniformis]|nr:amino acid permease [Bacillus licheniformis]